MAKIIYSIPASELIGSIAGSTFQRNSSGCIVRSKPSKKQNPSNFQSVMHRRLAGLSSLWASLTVFQKSGWNALAAAQQHEGQFGQLTQLNGFQQFQSNNLNLAVCNVASIVDAPAYLLPTAPPAFELIFEANRMYLLFSVPFVPALDYFCCYATPPLRRNSNQTRLNNFLMAPGSWTSSTIYDITAAYEACFGIVYASFAASANCSIVTRVSVIDQVTGFRSSEISQVAKPALAVPLNALIVDGGSGSGSYAANSVVPIIANAPAPGLIFETWSGQTYVLDNLLLASTNVNMPNFSVYVHSNYIPNPFEVYLGALYNFYAAAYSVGGASIAPAGWHVPSYNDMVSIYTTLGGQYAAGAHLKESGLTWWSSPNAGADNSSGFFGRGSGERASGTGFQNKLVSTLFPTLPERTPTYVDAFVLTKNNIYFERSSYSLKNYGNPLRLIKNDAVLASMTDYDGNTYPTVKIGNLVIMAANLCVTHYNNGVPIPNILTTALWDADTNGAMCAYLNDWHNVSSAY